MGFFDLFKPKYKHADSKVRREAVADLDDMDILIELARTDESAFVRRAATRKIDDQKTLEFLVINDQSNFVRQVAVEKVENQRVLYNVARNDSDVSICSEALDRITDEEYLKKLFKISRDGYLRQKLLRRITDPSFLRRGCHDSDEHVRAIAVDSIDDTDTLVQVGKKTRYHDVRESIFKKVDTSSKVEIIRYSPNYSKIKHISDSEQLVIAYEAVNNPNPNIRVDMVSKLNDIEVLEYLLNDSYFKDYFDLGGSSRVYPVREAASRRLSLLQNDE